MVEAKFMEICAAADLIGVGATEIELIAMIRDVCQYGDLQMGEVPATGHPTRYFEEEDGKRVEKSAPLTAITCEFDLLADAQKAVESVWNLYISEVLRLKRENPGHLLCCYWLSDPYPRVFENPTASKRYVALKFGALVVRNKPKPSGAYIERKSRSQTEELQEAYRELDEMEKSLHALRTSHTELLGIVNRIFGLMSHDIIDRAEAVQKMDK